MRAHEPARPLAGIPRAGARLAGCVVEGELGRGAMGVVLRAREEATGRPVALKLLLDAHSPERRARFEREGELLARLDHPGIVRVHGAGHDQGRPWLKQELVAGARPLGQAAGGLPLAERALLVRDAARAAGHAHARGVLHRDLKPANILVDAAGLVRLTDFGLAACADLERLTATGQVLGTPLYMAPEQLDGARAPFTPATDVWALGVVLFELVAGAPPFAGGSLLQLFAAVERGAPPLRARAPRASRALEEVVARCLSPAPADRFTDGAALADALDAALAAPGAAPARGLPLLLAGGLALVAGGLGAAQLAPRASAPRPDAPAAQPSRQRPAPAAAAPAPRPPAPDGGWSALVHAASSEAELRRAARLLDVELAAGRPPTPAARAAALTTLAARDARWARPADGPASGIAGPLRDLLWTHALWRRLAPDHLLDAERAAWLALRVAFVRRLADEGLLEALCADVAPREVGAEVARLAPDELEGYALHAEGCEDDPEAAGDLELLRRGLTLAAAKADDRAWAPCCRALALALSTRAEASSASGGELVALARRAAARNPEALALARTLASHHLDPPEALALMLVVDGSPAVRPLDLIERARAWGRLAGEPLEGAGGTVARGTAANALELVLSASELPPALEPRLGRAAATVCDALPGALALPLLERCLARRPAGHPGLSLRRALLRAEQGATSEEVAAALRDLQGRLRARRASWSGDAEDAAWLDRELALTLELEGRPPPEVAARLRAEGAARRRVTRLLDR